MPDLVLDLLKYAFLAVLYLFIARAVRAIYLELKPAGAARPPAAAPPRSSSKRGGKPPRKLAIVEGASTSGKSFDLRDELLIGRAEKCHIVLDDSYVSQVHARVYSRDGGYYVEDLGSTNGTYLNRRRITAPAPVNKGDRVKIGKTTMELRR